MRKIIMNSKYFTDQPGKSINNNNDDYTNKWMIIIE